MCCDKEKGKLVWPICVTMDSDRCRHKLRETETYTIRREGKKLFGAREKVSCGHPAAAGAPCAYWSCPIAVYEPVVKDNFTTDDADAPEWVEASATAADGSIYWVRESGPDAAAKAQARADYLVQCRCAKEA